MEARFVALFFDGQVERRTNLRRWSYAVELRTAIKLQATNFAYPLNIIESRMLIPEPIFHDREILPGPNLYDHNRLRGTFID